MFPRVSIATKFRALALALLATVLVGGGLAGPAATSERRVAIPAQEPVWHGLLRAFQGTRVHLATGRVSRPYIEAETWFDETRDELRAVFRRDGKTIQRLAGRSGDVAEAEGLFPFRPTSLFRDAFEKGTLREVGRGTLRGQPVIWLEAPPDEGFRSRVAVHAETYQPLQLQFYLEAALLLEIEVVRLERTSRTGTPLEQPATGWSSFEDSEIETEGTLRSTTLARARRAFPRAALWAGPKIAGHAISSVFVGNAAARTDDGQGASARIVQLRYGSKRRNDPFPPLEIVEGTAAELSKVWALEGTLVPPAGTIDLARSWIGAENRAPRAHWDGYLQKGGFYVAISSGSRSTVLAAARALKPIPKDTSRWERLVRPSVPR